MKTPSGWLCMGAMIATFLLAALEAYPQTFRPVVRGKRGAVATGHPLAAEAGLRLLQQGGNAVDAGCAAILAASVVEKCPSSSKRARASRPSLTGRAPRRVSRHASSSSDERGGGITIRVCSTPEFPDTSPWRLTVPCLD